jgi:predicted Zn-dependent peptidase
MFEHMMFRGTDRLGPQDHFKYLRRFGGEVNGFTTFDTTTYIQVVPSNQIDLVFWLEAERMANLKINEEYFAAEREVVKEEYRNGHDRPYGTLPEKILPFIFTEHPYRWSTIGNLEHLDAATADELRDFFKTYYVPNNATLVVVGDVAPDAVLAKAQQYFGWIQRGADPPRITVVEPPVTEPRRLETYEAAPLPIVGVGFRVPPAAHADIAALTVLQNALSSGQSGRMYKKLVKETEQCIFAMAGLLPIEQAGLFGFAGVLRMGVAPEQVEAMMITEIERVRAEGIDSEELNKARNQAQAAAVKARMTVAGKARKLGYAATVLGNPNRVNTELEDIMNVTEDDVKRVANTYFKDEARLTLIVRPEITRIQKSFDFLRDVFGGKSKNDESK